ncbi:MAG: hypothetical protein EXR53_04280, partial [Dehalococcoidia bacterium]|nr:hypothetical protein [Dehalococcoidia bacterium]
MAGEILEKYGETIGGCRLVPSTHGKFHVYFNGELVLQHSHNPHHWPEAQEVAAKVEAWTANRRNAGLAGGKSTPPPI